MQYFTVHNTALAEAKIYDVRVAESINIR